MSKRAFFFIKTVVVILGICGAVVVSCDKPKPSDNTGTGLLADTPAAQAPGQSASGAQAGTIAAGDPATAGGAAAQASQAAAADVTVLEVTTKALAAASAPELTKFTLDGEYIKDEDNLGRTHIYTKRRGPGEQSKDMPYILMCYDLQGTLLWRSEVQYFVDLLELPDGKIFVGGTMKTWLLDPMGKLLYEQTFEEGSDIFSRFAIAPDGTILALLNATWLYAFSPEGKYLWRYGPGEHQAYRTPLVSNEGTVILFNHNKITGLKLNGKKLWEREFNRVGNASLVQDRVVYEPADYTIACLDAKTGKDLWQHKYGLSLGEFSFSNYRIHPSGKILLWALQGGVECLDAEGAVLWSYDESRQDGILRVGVEDCTANAAGDVFITTDAEMLKMNGDGQISMRLVFPRPMIENIRTAGVYVTLAYTDVAGSGDGGYPDGSGKQLCFDQHGKLVWSIGQQELGSVSNPTFYDSGLMLWHVYDNQNRESAKMVIWQPKNG